MTVTPGVLAVQAQLDRALDGHLDNHTRALVEAWAVGWSQVAGEVEAATLALTAAADDGVVTRTQVLRSRRASNALRAVAAQLQQLADQTSGLLVGDLEDVVRQAAAGEVALIGQQLPSGVLSMGFTRVDERALTAIVQRATERITSTSFQLAPAAQAAVRRELTRGVAVGDNPVTTARRMLAGVEDQFNGGLTRALVISRTETLDAHRQAAAAIDASRADVLAGWEWLASLSPRTCPACWGMHGTTHPIDEPGPLGHQQCRCARIPVTKPYARLGIAAPEPPSAMPSAERSFANLSPGQQRSVLGSKRFEAWQAGRYPMGSWATRRQNPGWRPSYVPSTPGRAAQSAA